MTKEFGTYDPGEVSLTFRNVKIGGFAEGTFIKAARDEDGFTAKAGSLGDVVRTRNRNLMGMVTVTLQTQSSSNSLLEAFAAQDEQFGTGFGPLQAVDHNSDDSEVHSLYAWVRKLPDWERSKESGTTEWVFGCADLEMKNGGANPLPMI